MDQLRHPRRLKLFAKVDLCCKQRRRPHAHELPEDVAQRQAVQKPQWMRPPLVLQVFGDLGLNGLQARENIAMR